MGIAVKNGPERTRKQHYFDRNRFRIGAAANFWQLHHGDHHHCASNGTCICQWDAVNFGFGGDECPGINEDDLCDIQIPGVDPFCGD